MGKTNQRKFELKSIAEAQCGYFTAMQAKIIGYSKVNHPYHVQQGNWLKISRGTYRLPSFEDTLEAKFSYWSLWSRNKNEQPQGIISYESALMYYGFIDKDKTTSVHITVSKGFQKRNIPKEEIILHKENLPLSNLENHGAFMTTNLFRTLKDTKEELEQKGIGKK